MATLYFVIFQANLGVIWAVAGGTVLVCATVNSVLLAGVTRLTFAQAKMEGSFRYAHARVRCYAESIAFYDGEREEEQHLDDACTLAIANKMRLIRFEAGLHAFQTGFFMASILVSVGIPGLLYLYMGASHAGYTDAEFAARINTMVGASQGVIQVLVSLLVYLNVMSQAVGCG
jgi:ABC-type uncharacterized transport system fused permease/ATPase subunit